MLTYACLFLLHAWLVTPRTCKRGNVISCVYLSSSSSVSTIIARSGHLGIWATHNHDISVEIVQKLASLCFESFGKPHERSKHCPCLSLLHSRLCAAHAHYLPQNVGKGRQEGLHCNPASDPANALCCKQDATCVGYMLSRDLFMAALIYCMFQPVWKSLLHCVWIVGHPFSWT